MLPWLLDKLWCPGGPCRFSRFVWVLLLLECDKGWVDESCEQCIPSKVKLILEDRFLGRRKEIERNFITMRVVRPWCETFTLMKCWRSGSVSFCIIQSSSVFRHFIQNVLTACDWQVVICIMSSFLCWQCEKQAWRCFPLFHHWPHR